MIGFAWLLRLFVTVITPDNPNPFITPLAVLTTVIALLAPMVDTARFGRSKLADLTLVFTSVLVASGAVLQLGPGEGDARRIVLAAHLIVGVLALVPVHLYLVGHLGEALRRRPVGLVRSGVGSLALVLGCVWTGTLITFVQAREMEPLVTPHWVTGWALVGLAALHAVRGRVALTQVETPPPATRRFLVEGLVPGAVVLVAAALVGLRIPDGGPWESPAGVSPEGQEALTNARTAHGGLLSDERWNWEPATCSSPGGYCHIDNVTQWKRSAHARSINPAYQAALGRFEDTRPGASAYCASCHEPRAALATVGYADQAPAHGPLQSQSQGVDGAFVSDGATGRATTIPPVPAGELGGGVGCQVCHRSTARAGDDGITAGYVMAPTPADLVRTAAIPFFNFPMVLAELDRHRAQFAGDAVLGGVDGCSTCHVHRVPDGVHPGVPGLLAADHRTPFADSEASDDGEDCAHCHMPRVYGPLDPTWTRSHAFPSGNTGVPWLLDLPERVQENQAFLRDDRVALELACPPSTPDGADCTATIRNVGVGHDFPGGPRDLEEVWLEVTATSTTASWSAGGLDADGRVESPPITFRVLLFDADGARLDQHEFWLAASMDGVPGIGPRATRRVPVRVPLQGPLEVQARLRHRRYNADFIRAAFGADHDLPPITDLVTVSVEVP